MVPGLALDRGCPDDKDTEGSCPDASLTAPSALLSEVEMGASLYLLGKVIASHCMGHA